MAPQTVARLAGGSGFVRERHHDESVLKYQGSGDTRLAGRKITITTFRRSSEVVAFKLLMEMLLPKGDRAYAIEGRGYVMTLANDARLAEPIVRHRLRSVLRVLRVKGKLVTYQ